MSRRLLRPRNDICHFCEFVTSTARSSRSTPRALTSARSITTSRKTRAHAQSQIQTQGRALSSQSKAGSLADVVERGGAGTTRTKDTPSHVAVQRNEVVLGMKAARKACDSLLSSQAAPTELQILQALDVCEYVARVLVEDPSKKTTTPTPKDGTAISAILSMDELKAKIKGPRKIPLENQASIEELSQLVYTVIRHPPIYISTQVLQVYVNVQATLVKAETFPEILELYANKPVPEEGSSPVRYAKQNPDKAANAIPAPIAQRALQTAIEAKQLGAAIDIVEVCYTTKSFLRSKFIRRALIPTAATLLAPVAAYSVASKMALYQSSMDNDAATNVAFAGILAYMGFTASIGIVALTTANDQMDRVTWAPGMPLHQRWIREDERAAIDKIAGSWGFRESWRRGDEEGEEWEALREWIGRKGMLLDRVELMEGME